MESFFLSKETSTLCHYNRRATGGAADCAGWPRALIWNRRFTLLIAQTMAKHHAGEWVFTHSVCVCAHSRKHYLAFSQNFRTRNNNVELCRNPKDHLIQLPSSCLKCLEEMRAEDPFALLFHDSLIKYILYLYTLSVLSHPWCSAHIKPMTSETFQTYWGI